MRQKLPNSVTGPNLMTGPSLFDRYKSIPGVPDELVMADGRMRPGWEGLIAKMSERTPEQLSQDFARGDQHLADAGVFFRKYGDDMLATRDWPFSHVPVILSGQEWHSISDGLKERADLLEHVVADIYGDNTLVRDGHLPAAIVAQNPEWLRPMVGVTPRSGHFLHFMAFEIGRGPDGGWWVLSDRTDAPSGTGFALENRVATTKIFPDLYRSSNVHRLAGFFRAFRDAFMGLQGHGGGGVLTPGPMTDTYYEQAYIARYLGLPLLQGEDLFLSGGQLNLRTVAGPAPIDALWRRMDGSWVDPLEFRSESQIGTPGLMSAIRQGNVSMVNALGVGVLESQALMAFLPRIARVLTGSGLSLPNVATWWCGQPTELAHVRANARGMMIGSALSTRMPYETQTIHAIGGEMYGTDAPDLDSWLSSDPASLMAKEMVTLSTTPVYENGALVPRPMTIRVFLVRTADGWQVMPGGFARIGAGAGTTGISLWAGGSVADVWVVSDTPVDKVTLLSANAAPFKRAQAGLLPSRAGDNLFWLGRYVERTEGLVRLVRAYHSRHAEAANPEFLAFIQTIVTAYGVDADEALPEGILRTLGAAVYSAGSIRDRFSVDGWAALSDMQKSMERIATTAVPGDDAALAMSVILRKLAGFSGLVHENMYRAAGWQFLTIGRSLERAAMMLDVLSHIVAPTAPEGAWDLAIEYGDSLMVHRQRYAVLAARDSVVDILALDADNPRSVRFHLDVIRRLSDDLAVLRPAGQITDFARAALELQTSLALSRPENLTSESLHRMQGQVLALTDALNTTYLH
jgi:uncharacterized circularly permuted ATP-grasp superfamily protein/uncharacterized alpha-E superfamily protein